MSHNRKIKQNKKITDLILMSYFIGRYKVPYILKKNDGCREVIFIGLEHTYKPNNPQLKKLESYLIYLKKKYSRKFAIITEGGEIKESDTKNKMIKNYGERGLLKFFSQKEDVPLLYCEPNLKEMVSFIKKEKIDRENIILWILFNLISQFVSDSGEISKKDKKIIIKNMAILKKIFEIRKTDLDLWQAFRRKLKRINLNDILPDKIDSLDKIKINKKRIVRLQDPFSSKTFINKAGAKVNNTREKLMFLKIIELLEKYKESGILTVLGANHVVAQKPAIDFYFKKEGVYKIPLRFPIPKL